MAQRKPCVTCSLQLLCSTYTLNSLRYQTRGRKDVNDAELAVARKLQVRSFPFLSFFVFSPEFFAIMAETSLEGPVPPYESFTVIVKHPPPACPRPSTSTLENSSQNDESDDLQTYVDFGTCILSHNRTSKSAQRLQGANWEHHYASFASERMYAKLPGSNETLFIYLSRNDSASQIFLDFALKKSSHNARIIPIGHPVDCPTKLLALPDNEPLRAQIGTPYH